MTPTTRTRRDHRVVTEDETVIALAVVPLVVGALAAMFCRRALWRLAPSAATVLLTSLALTVALATGLLLCLTAVVALAEVPPTSVLGHWSPHALRDSIHMPPEVGAVGGTIATLLVCSAAVHALRVAAQARRSSAAAAVLPPAGGDLVLVNDDSAIAYAIPGRHHRIVVSTGMLRTLSATQRRALLAHEAAHLRQHHHIYVQLGRLAAAANPLMRPVSHAVDLAVERWADEVAAREIGDRRAVAHALAAAALAHAPAPGGALAGAQTDIIDRIRVLLAPPPRRHAVATLIAANVVLCWTAAALVISHVDSLMELAQTVGAR